MFWYSEGPEMLGLHLWIDDVKYEKLGTIAQPMPKILNGTATTEQTSYRINYYTVWPK
jgi:hypothetical protein